MIKSDLLESPKPYLFVLNLRYSIAPLLTSVLKRANLLHKKGLNESQSHITVIDNWEYMKMILGI